MAGTRPAMNEGKTLQLKKCWHYDEVLIVQFRGAAYEDP
jgi:hypothetical protein